jgi:hypothetical protein
MYTDIYSREFKGIVQKGNIQKKEIRGQEGRTGRGGKQAITSKCSTKSFLTRARK